MAHDDVAEMEQNLSEIINPTSAVSSPKRRKLVDYASDMSRTEEENEIQEKSYQHQKQMIELQHLQARNVSYFDFTLQGVPG